VAKYLDWLAAKQQFESENSNQDTADELQRSESMSTSSNPLKRAWNQITQS
jgi:hypothetical protein